MTLRKYKAIYLVPSAKFPETWEVESKIFKARSLKEAKAEATLEDVKVQSVTSLTKNQAMLSTLRAGFRNINLDRRVRFELKHRHKGRPIKGRRLCPVPDLSVRVTIRNWGPK